MSVVRNEIDDRFGAPGVGATIVSLPGYCAGAQVADGSTPTCDLDEQGETQVTAITR